MSEALVSGAGGWVEIEAPGSSAVPLPVGIGTGRAEPRPASGPWSSSRPRSRPGGRGAAYGRATNPVASVRARSTVVTKGTTPVLPPAETRELLDRIDMGTLVGLRDRAILSVMVFSFARVSASVGIRRQDYFR